MANVLGKARTKTASNNKEYTVSKAAISKWVKQFRDECQDNPKAQSDYDYMKENLRLRKELEEAQKEVLFLKKAAAFFSPSFSFSIYLFYIFVKKCDIFILD